jgi:hypothetical protein
LQELGIVWCQAILIARAKILGWPSVFGQQMHLFKLSNSVAYRGAASDACVLHDPTIRNLRHAVSSERNKDLKDFGVGTCEL